MFGSFDRCCSAVEHDWQEGKVSVRIVDIRETVVPIQIRDSQPPISTSAKMTVMSFAGHRCRARWKTSNRYRLQFERAHAPSASCAIASFLASKPPLPNLSLTRREKSRSHSRWQVIMRNEKNPAVTASAPWRWVYDMAVWDAVAKLKVSPSTALPQPLSRRSFDNKVFVYAAGVYYYPRKRSQPCKTKCTATA